MLYITVGLMGCWGLGRLNPTPSDDTPSFFICLTLSLLLGSFLAYGLPLLTRLAPSLARLYPNYLAIDGELSPRYFRFGLISAYKFQRDSDGWILRLVDFDQKESLISIPKDDIKTKVETAFFVAGVAQNGLSSTVINQRRKTDEDFQNRIKTYRVQAHKRNLSSLPWNIGFLLLSFIFDLIASHYFNKNSPIFIVLLAVLFLGMVLLCVVDVRHKKSHARSLGLECPHCASLSINKYFMLNVARTHTCPYCGKLYYPLDV